MSCASMAEGNLVDPTALEMPRMQAKAPAAKKASKKKLPRKASAYNRQYAIEYRRLKKLHPRSKFASLTKKAHKATRRKMK